jgi:hypothetical protein
MPKQVAYVTYSVVTTQKLTTLVQFDDEGSLSLEETKRLADQAAETHYKDVVANTPINSFGISHVINGVMPFNAETNIPDGEQYLEFRDSHGTKT